MHNLKILRQTNGLTQQAMADLLNISRISYCRYENDSYDPPIDILCAIADKFDVSLDFIVGRTKKDLLPITEKQDDDVMPRDVKELSEFVRTIVRQEMAEHGADTDDQP